MKSLRQIVKLKQGKKNGEFLECQGKVMQNQVKKPMQENKKDRRQVSIPTTKVNPVHSFYIPMKVVVSLS